MTFGRKGLGPGDPAPGGINALRNTRPRPADDEIARKREAFLAAERGRRAEQVGGFSDHPSTYASPRPERSLLMAYLLWFILGQVSAHRFYLGAYRSAVMQVGLFFFWVALAMTAPEGSYNTLGPLLAVLVIGWVLWIVGDVFFIRGIHRKLCRRPGEAVAEAAVFA
jgi:hypothetical protein